MGRDEYRPLFETKKGKARFIYSYRAFAISVFVGICLIWVYRLSHIPKRELGEDGNYWVWLGLLAAELWFGFYWVLGQAPRWNPVFRQTFKNRLSQRYEKSLPRVDIFVCTADPEIEPAMMVINTVLSVMAYDYPTEKLSVFLSDDAASDITFYALLEASEFAKHWLPFCKRFNVEPRSPSAYFRSVASTTSLDDYGLAQELVAIKKLYQDMERSIQKAAKLGRVPEETHSKRKKAFSQWDSYSSRRDHDTILQILLHIKGLNSKDVDGCVLPTLVYLAREKRPHYPHYFKAGAMNSLLRVSSKISNGEIILNVDCDMYSNNSQSLRDALCFFMDKEKGHDITFVQSPQKFENVTPNDIYDCALLVHYEGFHGLDGYGGPLYIGTGCFHRRDILCGNKFNSLHKSDWKSENKFDQLKEVSMYEQVEESKALASCTYEENTTWGKELGLLYGCLVEDVITGLSIQCKGWKSMCYNPTRKAFLGLAVTTLLEALVQHKRWSEGEFQIFLSKYNVTWHGHGKISAGLQMGYCYYNLWAPNCLATLYYSIIPSLYLLKGTSLFPQLGLLYGCLVEDVITGLSIQCKGWKTVYYNPTRKAFLGLAPTTLLEALVQHKRWSEGGFQSFLSKYNAAWHAYGKISVGLQMGYCYYSLWAPNCLATLYYSIIPSLYLLKGNSLFPQTSSPWIIPFAYVILSEVTYSFFMFLWCGGTIRGWWNDFRMWLYNRTSSCLFAFIDNLSRLFGISDSAFIISAKIADDDVSQRFEKKIMEFGSSSPMFTLLATLALLNLFCFLGFLKEAVLSENGLIRVCENMTLQVALCGFLVLINLPLYEGLFLRKDEGRLPSSLTMKSAGLALTVCVLFRVWP